MGEKPVRPDMKTKMKKEERSVFVSVLHSVGLIGFKEEFKWKSGIGRRKRIEGNGSYQASIPLKFRVTKRK